VPLVGSIFRVSLKCLFMMALPIGKDPVANILDLNILKLFDRV